MNGHTISVGGFAILTLVFTVCISTSESFRAFMMVVVQ